MPGRSCERLAPALSSGTKPVSPAAYPQLSPGLVSAAPISRDLSRDVVGSREASRGAHAARRGRPVPRRPLPECAVTRALIGAPEKPAAALCVGGPPVAVPELQGALRLRAAISPEHEQRAWLVRKPSVTPFPRRAACPHRHRASRPRSEASARRTSTNRSDVAGVWTFHRHRGIGVKGRWRLGRASAGAVVDAGADVSIDLGAGTVTFGEARRDITRSAGLDDEQRRAGRRRRRRRRRRKGGGDRRSARCALLRVRQSLLCVGGLAPLRVSATVAKSHRGATNGIPRMTVA